MIQKLVMVAILPAMSFPRDSFLGLAFFCLGGCGAVAPEPSDSSIPPLTPTIPGPSPSASPDPSAPPSTTPVTPPVLATCSRPVLAEHQMRYGVAPLAALHATPCELTDFDSIGAVMHVVRTVDASKRFLTEAMDRVDDPPRHTTHDGVFGEPPRHTRIAFGYDGAGRLTLRTTDEGGDGSIDTREWWAFDGAGHAETEGSAWGLETSVTTRTFDAGGFVHVEATVTTDRPLRTSTFTRRADGAPLTLEVREGSAVKTSTTWAYDVSGTVTESEVSSIRVTTTVTDAKGRLLELREDQPKNGVDDHVQRNTYDASGNLVRSHVFQPGGEEYGDTVQTFDAAGRVIEIWKRWGPNTNVEKLTYDACGQIVSIRRFSSGAPQSSVDRAYDARGYLVMEQEQRMIPMMKPMRTLQTFDAKGHLTVSAVEERTGVTWAKSSTEASTYDSAGHLLEKLATTSSMSSRREAWSYDAAGDLVVHGIPASGPGSIVREEMSYACFAP